MRQMKTLGKRKFKIFLACFQANCYSVGLLSNWSLEPLKGSPHVVHTPSQLSPHEKKLQKAPSTQAAVIRSQDMHEWPQVSNLNIIQCLLLQGTMLLLKTLTVHSTLVCVQETTCA